MKKILIGGCLLTISSLALASQNVGFTAKNNQDPIFIEKCDMYKNAQKNNNIELLKTFVEKKWFEGDKATKIEAFIVKMAKKRQKKLKKAGGYILTEKRMSTKTQPNVSHVVIEWNNGKKSYHSDGCVFKMDINQNGWRITIR